MQEKGGWGEGTRPTHSIINPLSLRDCLISRLFNSIDNFPSGSLKRVRILGFDDVQSRVHDGVGFVDEGFRSRNDGGGDVVGFWRCKGKGARSEQRGKVNGVSRKGRGELRIRSGQLRIFFTGRTLFNVRWQTTKTDIDRGVDDLTTRDQEKDPRGKDRTKGKREREKKREEKRTVRGIR